jgi:uncharacterized protein YegP (UPF0339 family)
VWRDGKKEWRWHLVAANGKLIATCGEGYKNKAHAVRMGESITGLEAEYR